MSHSVVLIIREYSENMESIDEILAPFYENLEVDEYVKFTREDKKEERQKEIKEFTEILAKSDEDKKRYNIKFISGELEEIQAMTDEEYFQKEAGWYEEHNENDEPLTTCNPQSKWDWFETGGRWAGMLLLKEGRIGLEPSPSLMLSDTAVEEIKGNSLLVDEARKGDIDFEGMVAQNKIDAEKNWNEAFKGYPILHTGSSEKEIKDNERMRNFRFGIKEGMTKEEYIANRGDTAFSTFAVVKNGKWYERGGMGWFGMVADEKDSDVWEREYIKLLEDTPDDAILTIVDVHI